ncbi:MAG TPA: uridine diphosphate-N-acetylglucosamine-binding protein YvcK, partial [Limnochordales bacterium]
QFSRVLAVRGQVLPSTLATVQLEAEFEDGSRVVGESAIPQVRKPIRSLHLVPRVVRAVPEAVEALQSADVVVLGPGSLYTSVIPNLLVPELAAALRTTQALRLYVCNVMTQPGETDGYSASDHLKALLRHAGPGVVDCVLVNDGRVPPELLARYRQEGAMPVEPDVPELLAMGVVVISGPLLAAGQVVRHDSARLAQVVAALAVLGRSFAPAGTHLPLGRVLAMAQRRGRAGRSRSAGRAGRTTPGVGLA